MTAGAADARISTGLDGLDTVLDGGLIPGRSYLLCGEPGTGKTLFGAQFLAAGVDADETALFVNLEEAPEDVERNAAAAGVDVTGVEFLDLRPDADVFTGSRDYDVFAPAGVEQERIAERITETVEALEPDRVFVDPLTKLRYVTADESRFDR
jgi:circadian clock protein KaiC